MNTKFSIFFLWPVFFLSVSFILSGCSSKNKNPRHGTGMSMPVVTYTVLPKPLTDKISLVGSLTSNASIEVRNELEGKVDMINFIEGAEVKKGHPLIYIDQKKLEASLKEAKANLELAESNLKRYETLVASNAVSRQEYEKAKADFESAKASFNIAEERLNEAIIKAPFDGIIGEKLISMGQFLNKGERLTYLVSLDPINVNVEIPERFISLITLNQDVEVSISAYPSEIFHGKVYFIDPQITRETRTILIKARLSNAEKKLRPGMFANLDLITLKKDATLLIPEIALNYEGNKTTIYVIDKNMKAQIRSVTTGTRIESFVEILEGVTQGDIVVTEGHQKLFPEAPVMIVEGKSK